MSQLTYLMHVDWRWITQRPHLLVRAMERQGAKPTVFYTPSWSRRGLVGQASPEVRPLITLPPVSNTVRGTITPALHRMQLRGLRSPDVIWITHPWLWPSVPISWRDRVVYDAMDLAVELAPPSRRAQTRRLEEEVSRTAKVVFCSSQAIACHMEAEYGRSQCDLSILHNACDERSDWPIFDERLPPLPKRPTALYFGTVSSWFDYEAVFAALQEMPELEVQVIGPRDRGGPVHPRLTHLSAMEHGDLFRYAVRNASVLVMPFKRSKLIEAVDPVKLYEYIALGRPIVAPYYPGLDRFRAFVQFYSSPVEFAQAIRTCCLRQEFQPLAAARAFVKENTWTSRAQQAISVLRQAGLCMP